MTIDRIYLGTWFPRTSLHLKELFQFLNDKQGVEGLDPEKTKHYWGKLNVQSVTFHEETDFDHLDVRCDDIDISITEDGLILFSLVEHNYRQAVAKLSTFYSQHFGPALHHLFSLGAPLPKQLRDIEEIYPLILVTTKMASDTVAQNFFKTIKESCVSIIHSSHTTIYYGTNSNIFNIRDRQKVDQHMLRELLGTIVFFREFENQLGKCLASHRSIWDEISKIRESTSLRYADFPMIRAKILDFLKTLSFGKARLEQMDDVITARQKVTGDVIKKELDGLAINRFEHLKADQQYVSHLWLMTIEYVQGTLALLESLFEENTQRELNTLKLITLIGALAGFFGMNIAFPWEDRWPMTSASSLVVVIIIAAVSLAFYYLLKFFVHYRRFDIKDKTKD